jgi:hypothetical protein
LSEILVRELSRLERPALERHLLALGGQDRRLRFGAALNDSAVSAYVERIDFERDALFGVFDDALHLTGVAHVARSGAHAELGVSCSRALRPATFASARFSIFSLGRISPPCACLPIMP